MPLKAHRHGDSRVCGATTTVENQSTVYVNGQLWAVKNSTNSDGNGKLINSSGTTVIVNNLEVIVHGPDHAQPDNKCPLGQHCDPYTSEGSGDVFCY
jgi:uncharacterized Zn-binding protein involved in type VI secretion